MIALGDVQGCAGLCRVIFFNPTHSQSAYFERCRVSCWVCRVVGRAGVCTYIFFEVLASRWKKHHANPEKAYTPCTLCTERHKELIYIGFICVWFVLGCVLSVLGSDFWGNAQ